MKYRKNEDINILNEASLDLSELSSRVDRLFNVDGFLGVLPSDIYEYGKGVMIKNYEVAKDSQIKGLILRKILHTREVVEAGKAISEKEESVIFDPAVIATLSFAHDWGRFPQAHLGSFSDIRTKYDHANASAEMYLAGRFEPVGETAVESGRIAEAIREHSKLAYTGNDVYGKFVRDADKLGLLEYFHYHIHDYEVVDGEVTPGALEAFLEGRSVLKQDLNTKIDVHLSWLSWVYDMNFVATRELFETGGMSEYILREIKMMDVKVYEKVVEKLQELSSK